MVRTKVSLFYLTRWLHKRPTWQQWGRSIAASPLLSPESRTCHPCTLARPLHVPLTCILSQGAFSGDAQNKKIKLLHCPAKIVHLNDGGGEATDRITYHNMSNAAGSSITRRIEAPGLGMWLVLLSGRASGDITKIIEFMLNWDTRRRTAGTFYLTGEPHQSCEIGALLRQCQGHKPRGLPWFIKKIEIIVINIGDSKSALQTIAHVSTQFK